MSLRLFATVAVLSSTSVPPVAAGETTCISGEATCARDQHASGVNGSALVQKKRELARKTDGAASGSYTVVIESGNLAEEDVRDVVDILLHEDAGKMDDLYMPDACCFMIGAPSALPDTTGKFTKICGKEMHRAEQAYDKDGVENPAGTVRVKGNVITYRDCVPREESLEHSVGYHNEVHVVEFAGRPDGGKLRVMFNIAADFSEGC